MEKELTNEIEAALTQDPDTIPLESVQDVASSPLNQPIKEKDIAQTTTIPNTATSTQADPDDYRTQATQDQHQEKANEPLDAPEQEIGTAADPVETTSTQNETTSFEDQQATMVATAMLGMADNLLAVGGGYFVKIKKHPEFYDYEEIVEIIDTQNEKNINRIRLDEDDKALLTPLLAQVLKNKSQQLSPEQQLLGAVISIVIKKAQIVIEMRSENKSLESRILDIVRAEKVADSPTVKDPAASQVRQTPQKPPVDPQTETVSTRKEQESTAPLYQKNQIDDTDFEDSVTPSGLSPGSGLAAVYKEADEQPVIHQKSRDNPKRE